jgi:hypothetical protein
MINLLSAKTKIPPRGLSGFGEQVIDRCSEPALMTFDRQGLQTIFMRLGKTVVQRSTGKLDSPGKYDQFDLIKTELGEGFGRA